VLLGQNKKTLLAHVLKCIKRTCETATDDQEEKHTWDDGEES